MFASPPETISFRSKVYPDLPVPVQVIIRNPLKKQALIRFEALWSDVRKVQLLVHNQGSDRLLSVENPTLLRAV